MRRFAVCVVAVATVGTAAGCGGTKWDRAFPPANKPVNAAVLRAAAVKSAGAHTARVNVATAIGSDQGGLTEKVDGVADFGTGAATYDMHIKVSTGESLPDGVTLRIVGAQIFVQLPPKLREEAGARTSWVTVSQDQVGVAGNSLGGLQTFASPTSIFDALRSVNHDVVAVRHENKNGVPTTHYRASLDLVTIFRAVGGRPGPLSRLRKSAFPIDVWVDDAGLVREVDVRYDLTALAGALPGSAKLPSHAVLTMKTKITGYGVPVEVHPPPAKQVSRLPQNEQIFGHLE